MKVYCLTTICAALATTSLSGAALRAPYNMATPLPYCAPEEYSCHDDLGMLIRQFHVKIAIDIACKSGFSSIDIAKRLPKEAKLYSINNWKTAEREYDQFLSNIIHQGLTQKIIPIRTVTKKAAKALPFSADLIHINAPRSFDACYQELALWHPSLAPMGVMCGTVTEDNQDAADAVLQFANDHYLQLHVRKDFWWMTTLEMSKMTW